MSANTMSTANTMTTTKKVIQRKRECTFYYGRAGRLAVLFLAIGGIIMSISSIQSCGFYHIESVTGEPWEGMNAPLESVVGVDMGLFKYRITDSTDANDFKHSTSRCASYGGRFQRLDFHENDDLWAIAQAVAVYAPVVAFFGILLSFVEACCCNFFGSSIFPGMFFFMASALQSCTFLVFGKSEYCFVGESTLQCRLDDGGYFSVAATGGYFLATLLLCCLPRVAPFVETAWCCKSTRELMQPKSSSSDGKSVGTKNHVVPAHTMQTHTDAGSTIHQHSKTTARTRLNTFDEEAGESSASSDDSSVSDDDDESYTSSS